MDHDEALEALVAAKAQCSDACADEAVHAPHRAALEQAYATYAAASKAVADREAAQRAAAGLPPIEPEGFVTVTKGASDGS